MRTRGSSPLVLPRYAAPLLDRAIALESQWDLAHRGLHCDVRGVPGDQAPLRAVEIFLLHLLDQEGEKARDPNANGMRGHPPPGAVGGRVYALLAIKIQQGVACMVVLLE